MKLITTDDAPTTIEGTSGDDYFIGTAADDYFDLHQGGHDTAFASGGNDTFYLGSTFDASDELFGGTGNDVLELAGNYYGYNIPSGHGGPPLFISAAVTFGANTVQEVETILLDAGAGYGYDLILNAATDPAGASLTVDGSDLVSAPMIVDGTQVTGELTFKVSDTTFDLTGGAANDTLDLDGIGASGSVFDGGPGFDIVHIDPMEKFVTSPVQITLDGSEFKNIEYMFLEGGYSYDITLTDKQATGTFGVYAVQAASLVFDGSEETNARLQISGSYGDDTLTGGHKGDQFEAYWGVDTIYGGGGNDYVHVQFTAGVTAGLTVDGGSGHNTIDYGYVDNGVTINLANGTGHDASGLISEHLSRIQVVAGTYLNDTLVGSSGADTLLGSEGADTLSGGSGGDTLEGGAGADRLNGGAGGKDHFVFTSTFESTAQNPDVIAAHWASSDIIDISAIDANTAMSGNQAFVFGGEIASVSKLAAHELAYYHAKGDTYVVADTNGDGKTDFQITIAGIHNLTASEFVL